MSVTQALSAHLCQAREDESQSQRASGSKSSSCTQTNANCVLPWLVYSEKHLLQKQTVSSRALCNISCLQHSKSGNVGDKWPPAPPRSPPPCSLLFGFTVYQHPPHRRAGACRVIGSRYPHQAVRRAGEQNEFAVRHYRNVPDFLLLFFLLLRKEGKKVSHLWFIWKHPSTMNLI